LKEPGGVVGQRSILLRKVKKDREKAPGGAEKLRNTLHRKVKKDKLPEPAKGVNIPICVIQDVAKKLHNYNI